MVDKTPTRANNDHHNNGYENRANNDEQCFVFARRRRRGQNNGSSRGIFLLRQCQSRTKFRLVVGVLGHEDVRKNRGRQKLFLFLIAFLDFVFPKRVQGQSHVSLVIQERRRDVVFGLIEASLSFFAWYVQLAITI